MDIFEFGYQCYDKYLLFRRCQNVFVSTLLNSCCICAWCSSWQESRENAWRKSASTMGCPWSKQGARSSGHGEFLDGCCSSVPMWPCGFGTGSVWSTILVNFQGLRDWWKQLISVVLSGKYQCLTRFTSMRLVDMEVMNHTLILYHVYIYIFFLVLADWKKWCKSFIQPSRYLGPSMRMFRTTGRCWFGSASQKVTRSPGRVGWGPGWLVYPKINGK